MTGAPVLAWGAASDRGRRRAANEDAFLAAPPVFLVADGMGGHDSGEVASATALDAFRGLIGLPSVGPEQIEAAFAQAATGVAGIESPVSAAGTTLTGVAISSESGASYWLILNLGDSRTYRHTASGLEQVSVDHSVIQELVDAGSLRPADADRHPARNVVTKAIGAGSNAVPDYWLLPAAAGDRILVCSDGLTKELPDAALAAALAEEADPQTAADRLVAEALVAGGRDNVTVVVVDACSLGDGADRDTDGGDETVPTFPLDDSTLPRSLAEDTLDQGDADAPL